LPESKSLNNRIDSKLKMKQNFNNLSNCKKLNKEHTRKQQREQELNKRQQIKTDFKLNKMLEWKQKRRQSC